MFDLAKYRTLRKMVLDQLVCLRNEGCDDEETWCFWHSRMCSIRRRAHRVGIV